MKTKMNSNFKIQSGVTVRIFKSLTFLALGFVFFSLVGCENKMHTQRGSIGGLVTDAEGNRVTGAVVTSHRSLFKAETDEKGYYTFTSLDVGSHRLKVERNGYFLASKTVDLGYGQVLEGINIQVEPLEEMIRHNVISKTTENAVIEVICREPMSVWAGWREKSSMRLQTPPTEVALRHTIELKGLFANSHYLVEIEGLTADGRKFVSPQITFKTVARGDIPGDPSAVENMKIAQSLTGPAITWEYTGIDPVQGFRVYRSINREPQQQLADETMVYSEQMFFTDSGTFPGNFYEYYVQAVDLEGNVSSMSQKVSIVPAGKIVQDIRWNKELSPIHLNGDLYIPAGRTLTIDADTTVVFADEDAGRTGFSPLICEMTVEGTLKAKGTVDAPVRFISGASVPSRRDWDGIRIVATDGQEPSELQHVLVSGAEKGISINSSSSLISDILARFCQTGISLQGASGTTLMNIRAEDCDTGFLAESTWFSSVENLTVTDSIKGVELNGNAGLSLSRFAIMRAREFGLKAVPRSDVKLRNGLISSFKTGMIVGGASGDYQYLTIDAPAGIIVDGADVPIIRNCIIVNRQIPGTGYGIEEKTLGRTYQYNNIFGFLQPTRNCDQLGAPVINADPLFIGGSAESYDYRLRSQSPIISASDKGGQPGAYGSDI